MSNTSTCSSNVAVGALVAEMMTNVSNVSQNGQLTKQQVADNLSKEDIAQAMQALEQNQSSDQASLDAIKRMLTNLSQGSGFDAELQSWINGELNTANSYQPPSSLVNQLNQDMSQLQFQENQLSSDEGNLSSVESKLNGLDSELNQLKSEWSGAHWWTKIKLAVEIAGVGVAIGAVSLAADTIKGFIDLDKDNIATDQKQVASDEKSLDNNSTLSAYVSLIATGSEEMANEGKQGLMLYQSQQNCEKTLYSAVDGLAQTISQASQEK